MVKYFTQAVRRNLGILATVFLIAFSAQNISAQCQTCWSASNAGAITPSCSNQTLAFIPTTYQYWNATPGASYTFSVAGGTNWTTPWVEVYYYNGSIWACAGAGSSSVTVNPMPAANTAGNYLVVVNNGHACYGAWPGTGSAYSATLTYVQNNNLSATPASTELCSNGGSTSVTVSPTGGTLSNNTAVGSVSSTTYTAPSTSTASSTTLHYVMGACAANSGTITIDAQSNAGTLSNAGPINFCDPSGNFTTAISTSGYTGTPTWYYGWSSCATATTNLTGCSGAWVAGASSGIANFPSKTASSDGNADRIQVSVKNGVCPAALSSVVLLQDRYNAAPTSLVASSPSYCTNTAPGTVTLQANYGGSIDILGATAFSKVSCGGTDLGTVTAGNSVTSVTSAAFAAPTTAGVYTYYAQYQPGANTAGYTACSNSTCATTTITVNSLPAISSVTAGTNPLCGGSTTVLTANGITGTGATVNWYTASGGGGQLLGSGTTLTVGGDQTYYARVTGTCATPAEANLPVTLETSTPSVTAPANITTYTSPNNSCAAAQVFATPASSDNCTGENAATVNIFENSVLSPLITNLKLWVKGDAGVVMDGSGKVSEWRDLSGNGNHFKQATFSARPTKSAASTNFNGQNCITFTNAQFLTDVNNIDGAASSTYTIFTVSRMTGASNFRLISSASANWLMGYHGGYQDKLYCEGWMSSSGVLAVPTTVPHMYTVSSPGISPATTSMWDYGVAVALPTPTAAGTSGNPRNGPGILQLNGNGGSTSESSSGEVAEVIYFNTTLTTAQRQLVEGYLAYKYNMQAPLASMQAYQTYAAGNTTVTFVASDQSGNLSAPVNTTTTTATATATAYPGPAVAASATPVCQGTNVTLSTSGMAPAGKSLTTPAVNDYMLVGTSSTTSNVVIGSSWTLETWFNMANLSTLPGYGSWNTFFRGTSVGHHIIVQRNSVSSLVLGTYNGGFYSSGFNLTSLSSGWHHMAAVGTGGTTTFYIDGVKVGTSAGQTTEPIVAIGNYQGGGQAAGQMDEVRIWNTALSQNTISNNMTQAVSPSSANLVAYYKMDGNGTNSSTSAAACSTCGGTVQGTAVTSTATAFYTYTWSGPGSPAFSPSAASTSESVTISAPTNANSGNYTCIASANGCSSQTTTKNVQVDAQPVLTVPTAVCTNGTAALSSSVSVNWSVSSGTVNNASGTATTFTPATFAAPTQNQTITITAVNGTCSTNTPTIRVDNANSITAPTANPSPVCDNSTLAITGNIAGVVWTQSPSIGTIATTPGQSITFTPTALTGTTQNATTTITATNGVCTAQTLNVRVDHHNAITAPTANPSPVCDNGTLAITGTVAGVVWTMSPSIGSIATTPGQSVTFTPTALTGTTQNATTTITATNGVCTAQTLNVRVDHNLASVSAPAAICTNGTAAITSGVAGVSWTTTAGSLLPTSGQNTTLTPAAIGAPTQNQTVTVTATNGSCAVPAVIRVDNLNSILTPPTTVCNSTTAAFSGNISGVIWSSTAGTMSGAAQNATFTPQTITAPTANQNVTITATNGVCTAPTAVIRVDNQNAITSPPSFICDGSGTVALTGTISGVVWSTAMSAGITGTSITSPGINSTLTPGSVTGSNANANITVTATNGSCSATKVIQVDHQPTATVTTPTQAQCNSANFSLVATQNTFGTGTWSCVANCTGVTINSPNSYNAASASGVPVNTTTTVQWAIANGTCSSSTTETLRNDNQASISGSTALCVSDPNMQFNSSGAGTNPTPVWSVSPSTAGTITSGGLFTANAISGSTVSIPVTINLLNGTCLATYSTTLWNAVSIVPISNMCETDPPVTLSATINGNTVYGNPVSGPTFTGTGGTVVWNATLSRYIFTPPSQSGNSTNYNITVRSGSDSYCSDFQTVTVYKNTSGSVAGANQALCNTSTFSLAANNPTVGVGTWTISGTGTITSPSAYNTTVTGVPVGTTATLTWTIVNGSCNSSSSLTLTNSATATTSNAGTFQENCNIPTFTLAGNQPTVGSGLWTGSGTGTITTPTAYNSTVTGVPAGSSFVATWTITNGACSSNSSVTLQNDLAPTDIAPTVQSNPICGGTGTNIQILGSQIGVNYQLQTVSGPTNVGSPVAGTGGTISLPTGNLASNTTYDVKATYAATGCTRTMTVTPTVVVTAPDFAIGAQIVHTNFGAINNTVLPAGWGNAANTNGDNWALNSTNPATGAPYQYYNAIGGYTAASTGAYAKTPSNTTSSTPTVELVSASINTTGFSNVSVYWGAKKTTDYTGTVSLFYSIDNGVNWISQSFIDVASNVTGNPWNLANNTVQIKLPVTTSNITTLKLKWVANPSTDNSYYSINDVSVYGLSKINLCGTTLSVNYLNTSCSVSKYSVVSDPLNPWPAFSAVNNASLPATINITYPANTAAGTYNLDLSLSTASGASSGVISFPVTTEPGISATVNLDNCSCMDGSSVAQSVVSVYATGGGSGNFTFTPLNGTDVLQTVITGTGQSYSGGSHTGVKGVFWSKADGLPHNYQVSDAQCTVTVTQHTQNGAPTQIAFASSSQVPASLPGQGGGNGISGSYNNSGANSPGISSSKVNGPALTCHQTADFGNRWVTYIANNMDVNGNPNTNDSTNNKAMIEINNYGQELDSVAVSVYREPFLPSVPSSSGANSVCYLFPAYALERHYVIQSTKSTGANSFGSDVGVRLYFSDAELQDLIYWTNYAATVNASTVNASCASAQIVNNTGQLYVTKYTGPAEDGNYGNNTAAPTGLYRMFGPNTSLAGNGPIAAIDGGNGVFGNSLGANRHYVEFNVREFSELWLSGSGDIEPLPVEMIYFEAEAINNEYIQLGWATDIEINNKEFQVERSVDGNTWSQIGTVEGHGNSTTKITYTFDDMNVVPNVRYYYRLKQVDFNLQYKYTGIVSAEINGNGTFNVSVSPNPTYGTTNLIINTSKDQNITVDVYDVIGQKMVSGNNQLTSGYNRIQLELGHLASGTYSVTVTSANQVYTKKLVITK